MRALVLAAGHGERLRPLTDTVPKPMLELGGRPLIHYPLAMLRRGGITEVAVNVHHLAGEIERGLGDGSALGVHITYAPEPQLFGTGGPLNGLRGFFGNQPFVIANGDSILDLDLRAMIAFHRERAPLATIALFRPSNLDYYSRIEVDADGRIRRMRLLKRRNPLEFDDYPRTLADPDAPAEAYMYCGVTIAEPALFDFAPPQPPWALMSDLMAPVLAKGLPLAGYVHRGYFRTVDDRAGYESLKSELATSPPPFSSV
jgi:NDP-sugar pyrophosphorylase family protein